MVLLYIRIIPFIYPTKMTPPFPAVVVDCKTLVVMRENLLI